MLNKMMMIGHIGFKEAGTSPNGTKITKLSVAIKKKYKDRDGQQQEKTTWVNVKAFQKLAENMDSYAHKGDLVYIEGEFQQEKYTDKQGVEKVSVSILANEFRLLGNKGDKNAFLKPENHGNVKESKFIDDDIPW
jgi:single-strand DNA-binding protein